MTLPEIKKEETNEQTKIKICPDCGKPCKNLPVHQRYCKARMAMKQETLLESTTSEKTLAEPITSPLKISEVQAYHGDEVAWFQDGDTKFSRPLLYMGIVNNMPTVLVLLDDGTLVPPYTVSGFVGVTERDEDDEPFPPFPEEEEEKKTEIKAQLLEEKITFTPESKPVENPKKSWWPFSHKKTVNPKTTQTDKTELKELVEGAINVTG